MMVIDVTQALKDTENVLREFIAQVLARTLGPDWVEQCGVSTDRLERWRERKRVEESRQRSGSVDERLLYYADFYDLQTILKKHWAGEFSEAFGEWRRMEVWLSTLEALRDPDAHRRELLSHQKHLALGVAGEVRTLLVRYRSKLETGEDCYPRIESARDSLGNVIIPTSMPSILNSGMKLRVGDTVDFLVTASDPLGDELQYKLDTIPFIQAEWQHDNNFRLTFHTSHRQFEVRLLVRSPRPYHASTEFDDMVDFMYEVLPPLNSA